jgi:transcriptional regulator with GAF, ATPase, and Fis domain
MINSGVEIAKILKIPSNVIRSMVIIALIVSSTVMGTLRWKEADLKSQHDDAVLAKLDSIIVTNTLVVQSLEGLQKNTHDLSIVTEDVWLESKDMFIKMIAQREPLHSIITEKAKKMDKETNEKLPHLNGTLKIGIRPKK